MRKTEIASLNEIISLTLLVMMGLALLASPVGLDPGKRVAERIHDVEAGVVLSLIDEDYRFRHDGE